MTLFRAAGQTLSPGIYTSPTTMVVTTDLTLDAQQNANATWIFQAGTTLATAAATKIKLINGANASNVFWQVQTAPPPSPPRPHRFLLSGKRLITYS